MADISSIKMPNGSIYDLKDKNAQTKINVSGILEGDGQGGISESDILDYDTDTTSGSVVSFTADGVAPLKALSLAIDPVQDLHGYDNPWPAGGGANKWNGKFVASNFVELDAFTTPCYAGFNALPITVGSTYTASINGTAAGIRYVFLDSTFTAIGDAVNAVTTAAAPSNAVYLRWRIRDEATADGKYQIESGSTPSAWTPYANLCPISGWTEANVWRTGKNLLDVSGYQIETSSAYNKSAGTTLTFGGTGASVSGTNPIEIAVTTGWRGATFFSKPLKVGATYYLRYRITAPSPGYIKRTIYWVDDDNKIVVNLGYSSSVDQSAEYVYHNTLTPPQDGLRLAFVVESQTSQTITIYDMGVMFGGWETYTPYTGNQYTIQLDQTVYGGTLDVLSGVLTVDRASITLVGAQSETWSTYDPSNYDSFCFVYSKSDKTKNVRTSKCNLFKNVETAWGAGGNGVYGVFSDHPNIPNWYFRLPYSGFTETVEAWKEWLASNPLQIVYELATPLTYILTPQQLDTLTEQNVLWADSGAVSLEYRKGENALLQDISEAIKNLQGKIRVSGLLKSDGNGNVTAAINGTDYSKVIIRDWSVT